VRWCADGNNFFGDFASCISASRVQHVSDLHSKFALMPRHVWKYIDIQCATAEIRRGKKEERRKKKKNKPQGKNIMSASTTQGGHKNCELLEAVVAVMNSRLLDMALQRIT